MFTGTAKIINWGQSYNHFKIAPLSGVYIGEGGAITLATRTHNSDTLVLALATLGDVT